jgi:hypothetical protein
MQAADQARQSMTDQGPVGKQSRWAINMIDEELRPCYDLQLKFIGL